MRLDFLRWPGWPCVGEARAAEEPGWRRVRAVGGLCSRADVRYGLPGTSSSTRHARRLIGHAVFLVGRSGLFRGLFFGFSKGIFLEASGPGGSAMTCVVVRQLSRLCWDCPFF